MNTYISGRTAPEYSLTPKLRQRKPERFVEELYRSPRENHTQKRFVPVAMSFSLQPTSRWKAPAPRQEPKRAGITHSPSTMQLNRSNVKRKPSARGRTR